MSTTFDGIDIAGVTAYRESIVASKFKGLQGLVKARGITVIEGEGRLVAPNAVQVGDDRSSARTSSSPPARTRRSLPGLEIGGRVITSEQALELDFVPKKVAVLGGGVIGVEFASVWKSFGAEVTIIEALPHLVPNEEESVSKQLERAFRKRGIEYKLGVRFQGVTQNDDGVVVTLENGETVEAELLLVAVGRGPSPQGLGFEEVGVTIDRGFVITDERLATNVPGVYAVGDIVPGLQLAHRGFQQGIFVAEEIAGLNPIVVDDVNIPKVTYCDPEVASVGYTEAKAAEKFGADAGLVVRLQPRRQRQEPHPRHQRLDQGRPRERRPRRRRAHDRRPRRRADRRGPARRELGGVPRGHRAVHPRAPDAERGARRGVPQARRQAAARALSPTPHDHDCNKLESVTRCEGDKRMSESVSLPALGESVTEGTVTRWLKNVGDRVEVDEPLLEVSTDKVDTEIPSPVAGVIEAILVQEDETVEVGTALVTIGDGSGAAAAPEAPAEAAPAAERRSSGA